MERRLATDTNKAVARRKEGRSGLIDLRHRPSDTTMAGAVFLGTTGAYLAGPVGAVTGLVLGGLAGSALDFALAHRQESTPPRSDDDTPRSA